MNGTFDELIASDTPVLIDFYAEWCKSCRAITPALQQLADDMGEKVNIIKIDIDKNKALQRKFKITSVPTIMIFKDSRQLFRQTGVMMLPQLKKALSRYVKD